ncbi:hypothetical protein Tco_0572603, partial [Tanacetum coccineum]
LEARRYQVEDLEPTIEEGEVIYEPIKGIVKTRNDVDEITNGIKDYPSFCDHDRKIHVNDFAVLEDMDAYRDKEMGDVIVVKEFRKEIGVKAKRLKE